jgi:hypothetical protein
MTNLTKEILVTQINHLATIRDEYHTDDLRFDKLVENIQITIDALINIVESLDYLDPILMQQQRKKAEEYAKLQNSIYN